MEPNPVVIVTGSMQDRKCPRGACRYDAEVFEKRHSLFKVAVHGGGKKKKKADLYSENAIVVIFSYFYDQN